MQEFNLNINKLHIKYVVEWNQPVQNIILSYINCTINLDTAKKFIHWNLEIFKNKLENFDSTQTNL